MAKNDKKKSVGSIVAWIIVTMVLLTVIGVLIAAICYSQQNGITTAQQLANWFSWLGFARTPQTPEAETVKAVIRV